LTLPRPARPFLLGLGLLVVVGAPAWASAAEGGGDIEAPRFVALLALALGSAKLGGEIAERLRQPAVLGELLAGVLIGPSVLGQLTAFHLDTEIPAFHLFAEIGVVLLLFEIGLETDLGALIRVGLRATLVAVIGVVVPFALAFVAIEALAGAGWLPVPEEIRVLMGIFVGATLTATSVGITARVLQDLGRMHTQEARVLIGAAVIDDVLGLVILAVVTALGVAASSGLPVSEALSPLMILTKLVVACGFLAGAIVVGRYVAPRFFDIVDAMRVRGVLLIAAVIFAFVLAVAAHAVGSALIVGGFAAGLVLSGTNQFDQIEERIKPVADVFTPVFFVIVGAQVDVAYFNVLDPARRPVLLVALVLLVAAVAGKVVAGVGVWRSGASMLAVGAGMIPRGEVGLIFAQVGYRLKVTVDGELVPLLDPGIYSAITLMVIMTTFVAPPLLRVIFARLPDREDGPPPSEPAPSPA
jgi:Kef-type K+ transport system membrane component KefB